ncbi:uncharacterized protein [Ptychodera flava]|uniref:uncharacterized protein n=1 Tax=Ptychodera flava TaxID=63121 RepID=UPI003969FCFC
MYSEHDLLQKRPHVKTTVEKHAVIETSICKITSAIHTVVSRSTRDVFRQACFKKLQVSDVHEMSNEIRSRLEWIACQRMGYLVPQDKQNKEWKNYQPSAQEEPLQLVPDVQRVLGTEINVHQSHMNTDQKILELEKDFNIFTDEEMEEIDSLLSPDCDAVLDNSNPRADKEFPSQHDSSDAFNVQTNLLAQDWSAYTEEVNPSQCLERGSQKTAVDVTLSQPDAVDNDWFEEILLDSDWPAGN